MSEINLESLREIPPATQVEITGIRNRLDTQTPRFVDDANYMAILAFGGTIQSAYVPSAENIVPVPMNPALARVNDLWDKFGIAGHESTGALLLAKDSRDLGDADVVSLIHLIKQIANRRVLVTCGTYKLPLITQALDAHFGNGKSDKIIGVTGSMLPTTIHGQDADFNIGGTAAAINAFNAAKSTGIVFAQFHGSIVMGADLETLGLHLEGRNPRLGHPVVPSI